MPQAIADLHCDFLTAEGAACVRPEELKGRRLLQCFAAFTKEAAAEFAAAASLFEKTFSGSGFERVTTAHGARAAWLGGSAACALTCENIGFTLGEYGAIKKLKERGVIMASLVWNFENALAYPNISGGKRQQRGLKERGRSALCALDENKIIVDLSHLSDGGVREVLMGRKVPVVASHSCCDALRPHPRNLTDDQLRAIAGCGGVVGVNFYKKFLDGDGAEAVFAHIKHIIRVAGEDAAALGSDWDGVPPGQSAVYPKDMPVLLKLFERLPPRVAEKVACENFMRVFAEVCGNS